MFPVQRNVWIPILGIVYDVQMVNIPVFRCRFSGSARNSYGILQEICLHFGTRLSPWCGGRGGCFKYVLIRRNTHHNTHTRTDSHLSNEKRWTPSAPDEWNRHAAPEPAPPIGIYADKLESIKKNNECFAVHPIFICNLYMTAPNNACLSTLKKRVARLWQRRTGEMGNRATLWQICPSPVAKCVLEGGGGVGSRWNK